VLDQRGQLLHAAVAFAGCSMPSYDRALWALRTWLDSWSGIGHVAVGMHRQGYDLQLTQYDDRGWRATFYTTGMEHSPTSATGTGWKAHAVARNAARGVGGVEEGGARGRTAMTPIEDKLIEVWHEFKIHAQNMGYTNQQNINECLNGAGAFLDFLCGRQPRAGTSYATATRWPTA
jgi:hypothetical protein